MTQADAGNKLGNKYGKVAVNPTSPQYPMKRPEISFRLVNLDILNCRKESGTNNDSPNRTLCEPCDSSFRELKRPSHIGETALAFRSPLNSRKSHPINAPNIEYKTTLNPIEIVREIISELSEGLSNESAAA